VVGAPGGGADPRIGSSARARRLGIGAALLVVAACSERPWLEGRVLDNFGRPLDRAIVTVSNAPLVEGAVMAGVQASVGASLAEVARAAAEATSIPKLPEA